MYDQTLFPVAFIDPPEILNTSVTNIPGSGSSPLQIVANIGKKSAYAVQWIDTTGDWIGLFTGSSGSEVLRTIIGGGASNGSTPVVIAAGSRVSLRSMTSSAITSGQLTITFLGQGWSGGST